MVKKVLVLCQRRTEGVGGRVLLNPQIETLLDIILGKGIEREIQYVSPSPGADIVGEFGNNEFTRTNFKENDYAAIILNTCPFIIIDFSIVYKYLKPDGLLVLSNYLSDEYPRGSSIKETETFQNLVSQSIFVKNGFQLKDLDMRNAVVFNKVIKGGRNNRKIRRTMRRRKTRRVRKTRRTRKYYKYSLCKLGHIE
jgi:hypothetical protein